MKNVFFLVALFASTLYANCFTVGAEWLYWRADQSEMTIASDVASFNTNALFESSVIKPDFGYDSGYRLFADYALSCDWTWGASFTHAPSHQGGGAVNDPNSTTDLIAFNVALFPIFTTYNDSSVFLSNIALEWDLDLYYLDTFLKRHYCPCASVHLEPYFGARGFWMRQTFSTSGTNPTAQATLASEFKEKFYGGGLLGGLWGQWDLGCFGLSVLGKFGGSLVFSRVHTALAVDADLAGTPLDLRADDNSYKSHPSLETFIGLQYSRCLCGYGIELHAGWENQLFFQTNNFTVTSDGNLTLQGLTLGGSINF